MVTLYGIELSILYNHVLCLFSWRAIDSPVKPSTPSISFHPTNPEAASGALSSLLRGAEQDGKFGVWGFRGLGWFRVANG